MPIGWTKAGGWPHWFVIEATGGYAGIPWQNSFYLPEQSRGTPATKPPGYSTGIPDTIVFGEFTYLR